MGEIWDQMNGLYVLVAHQARHKRILLLAMSSLLWTSSMLMSHVM